MKEMECGIKASSRRIRIIIIIIALEQRVEMTKARLLP